MQRQWPGARARELRPAADFIATQMVVERLLARLTGVFAGLGLLLAGIGLFAVVNDAAGARTQAAGLFAAAAVIAVVFLLAPVIALLPTALLGAVAMRRGQPQGPTNDQEVEDFIYDALEFLSGTSEVEVRCDGGRATLTGSVHHKRIKRDVGEIAWAIPGLQDVQNNVTITSRRRARAANREPEAQPNTQARK